MKAVENGGTAIGIRCKDGVVLAVEKIITSKLLKQGANKRIATADRHVGIVRSPCPIHDDITLSMQLDRCKSLLTTYYRCRLVWSPMAGISFPALETRLLRGETYTRLLYRSHLSPIDSAAMYKRLLSIPVCGRSE